MSLVELVLLNGERRSLDLPGGSGTVANALARLDDWIQTSDGGWVQKTFIVEVRSVEHEAPGSPGSKQELEALEQAAGRMADGG
jgi:hypothetical protein